MKKSVLEFIITFCTLRARDAYLWRLRSIFVRRVLIFWETVFIVRENKHESFIRPIPLDNYFCYDNNILCGEFR